MRIGIDLRRIRNPGIGRYMRGLVNSLVAQRAGHEYFLLTPPGTEHLLPPAGDGCHIISSELKYYSFREQFAIPALLHRYSVDLFHSPHFLIPLRRPCPTVITIHDVIYLACPGDLNSTVGRAYYSAMIRLAARAAETIVTDSEYSKRDIVRYLGVNASKIHVIYPGVDAQFASSRNEQTQRDLRARLGIRREFILYTGIYKQRKNHAGLIRAFRELVASGIDAELVIAGPLEQGQTTLQALAKEVGVADRVIFTGFVDDSDLRNLYAAARVYACPSLYEGFGFTVLEAMSAGTPVVCSAETSLPEVAGSAALYANPRCPQEFSAALQQAFCNSDVRRAMIAAGLNNAQRFSWSETARRTLSVYDQTMYAAVRN